MRKRFAPMRLFLLCAALLLSIEDTAQSQTPTIVAREVSGWFYSDGTMERSEPTFEYVIEIAGDKLVRRSVRNIQNGKTEVDDTEYEIVTNVSSHDPAALRFKRLSEAERPQSPVLRAVGMPGSDAIEILFVGPDWLQSVKTVKDYMVIQRFTRIQ
jgi:hypothetical protein